VPVNKVNDFQDTFLHHLEEHHAELLKELKAGKYTDEIIEKLRKVATDIAATYEK
jgi:F-type H+-transporting ATPase subunit alpha